MIGPALFLLSGACMLVGITSLAMAAWNAQAKEARLADGWASLAVNCGLSASLTSCAGLVAIIAKL